MVTTLVSKIKFGKRPYILNLREILIEAEVLGTLIEKCEWDKLVISEFFPWKCVI